MDNKGVIHTGILGQDGAINAGYYYYVLQTVKKALKALHFTMRILKKGNRKTKSLAYTSLVMSNS
jgi:hypothetical protein